MIFTILTAVIVLIGIFIIWIYWDSEHADRIIPTCITIMLLSCVYLGINLAHGYSEPNHKGYVKADIEDALRTTPNETNIKLAEDWNKIESEYNNIFFRFTLREENTIDIYKLLMEYKGE